MEDRIAPILPSLPPVPAATWFWDGANDAAVGAGDACIRTIVVCGPVSAATIKQHVGAFFPMAGGHHGTVMMLTFPPSAPVGVAVLIRLPRRMVVVVVVVLVVVAVPLIPAFFVIITFSFLFFVLMAEEVDTAVRPAGTSVDAGPGGLCTAVMLLG